ncbi:uncharacterized protein [Montipora foliosa]|uniref:uncharacterized protein isoform X2 n=1 Tax=Montipora foliosa TaxID=591990 RepID=UPI0035F139D9
MDNENSDGHHSSTDGTSSQIEINEATNKTEPSMFALAISLDSLPSSGQEEEDENNAGVQCREDYSSAEGWERLGARRRDSQRQNSLPGLSTSAIRPPQQSDTLAYHLKAKYSQHGTIYEDDHGPEHTQMELPLARPPSSLLPLQDGLADNFIVKHSCDETIVEDLHRGNEVEHSQALPSPSLLHEQVIGPEVSQGVEGNFLAKHSQDEPILEDLCKDDDTQVQPPLARPLPSPNLPQQDGLADNFIFKHSCDETILEDLHRGTEIECTQALPLPSLLHVHEKVIGPEVSEGLEVNILARHCQDDSILEDLQQQIGVSEEQPVAETLAWFPCFEQFWPCHQCHNLSRGCGEAEASNATHLKCSKCHSVQEIVKYNGATCQSCGIKIAAYFCWICKHLSNVDHDPYHCEKCGVCSYRTKSFHCDICGLCMNVLFKDNHKCRPSSAHDECLEIDGNSGVCGKCGAKMAAYSCSVCKHSTSVGKNPDHCEKCGICRVHAGSLDEGRKGNHKCRPDSGHDKCCICLEDAFSGCQILPCSHRVHRECAIAIIQNGIRTCPVCRHPLYSTPSE